MTTYFLATVHLSPRVLDGTRDYVVSRFPRNRWFKVVVFFLARVKVDISPGAAKSAVALNLSSPTHGRRRLQHVLEKQRMAVATPSLLANLYAFQWGSLNPPPPPPSSACVPGKTNPSPNNKSQQYFTQHFDFASVTKAQTR